MNRIILSSLVVLISLTIVSCKKDSSDKCYLSNTSITNNGGAYFKVTKVTKSGSDITSTYLSTCQLGSNIELYKDYTANYDEIFSTCSGSGSGNWSLNITQRTVSLNITTPASNPILIKDATVISWDCKSLVLSQQNGGNTYELTLTMQ
jgi:hypothetical protein